jgi:hypothetical protein
MTVLFMAEKSPPSHVGHVPAVQRPDTARGQFLRIEKFAIQAPKGKKGANNVQKVANEAARIEGYCPHVEHPLPPTILYGVCPLKAADLSFEWASAQKGLVFNKHKQSIDTRKFRDDRACALVGVISVPIEWKPDTRWKNFCEHCLRWLLEKFLDQRLKSVINHLDEKCLHIHFWVVPLLGESFSSVHPGEKAIDEVGRKSIRGIRDAAFNKAMANLLDEFHVAVGSQFGLERKTVGGRRWSRAELLLKKHYDDQRELKFKERLDIAVNVAIEQLKLDQMCTQALEKIEIIDAIKKEIIEKSTNTYPDVSAKNPGETIEYLNKIEKLNVTPLSALTELIAFAIKRKNDNNLNLPINLKNL